MTEEAQPSIRRILVALDESEGGVAALEAAALLASALRAELDALFIEDLNLVRLAGLPFARELLGTSALERRLDAAAMERALRTQGERLRRRLEKRLGAAQLRWRFSVVRGQVSRELLSRSTEVDLLILGRAGASPGRTAALGSTARAMLGSAECAVLLTGAGVLPGRPVVVLFDGSLAAQRALALAVRLAREDQQNLVVLLPEPIDAVLLRQVQTLLEQAGIAAVLRPVRAKDPSRIAAAVEDVGGRMFVAAAERREDRERFGAALSCPVLLVR